MANKVVGKVRDGLVILAALLMITMVVFQWMEIQKFELQTVISTRIAALFTSDSASAPASETPAAAPAAPGRPGRPAAKAPGL